MVGTLDGNQESHESGWINESGAPPCYFLWGAGRIPNFLSSFLGCPTPHRVWWCLQWLDLSHILEMTCIKALKSSVFLNCMITLLGTITHISYPLFESLIVPPFIWWDMWCDGSPGGYGFQATSHPIISPGGPTLLATSTAAKKANKQSWGDEDGTGHHVMSWWQKVLEKCYLNSIILGSFQKWVEKYHSHSIFGCIVFGKFSVTKLFSSWSHGGKKGESSQKWPNHSPLVKTQELTMLPSQ